MDVIIIYNRELVNTTRIYNNLNDFILDRNVNKLYIDSKNVIDLEYYIHKDTIEQIQKYQLYIIKVKKINKIIINLTSNGVDITDFKYQII